MLLRFPLRSGVYSFLNSGCEVSSSTVEVDVRGGIRWSGVIDFDDEGVSERRGMEGGCDDVGKAVRWVVRWHDLWKGLPVFSVEVGFDGVSFAIDDAVLSLVVRWSLGGRGVGFGIYQSTPCDSSTGDASDAIFRRCNHEIY